MLRGFKDFVLRGNVVDLAVAVVIGAAFTAVVNSFADSFLTPLIGLVTGGGRLGGVLVVNGQKFTYGAFLSQVITFVATAAVVYFAVVLPMKKLLERRPLFTEEWVYRPIGSDSEGRPGLPGALTGGHLRSAAAVQDLSGVTGSD